jgi:hypothetical protein
MGSGSSATSRPLGTPARMAYHSFTRPRVTQFSHSRNGTRWSSLAGAVIESVLRLGSHPTQWHPRVGTTDSLHTHSSTYVQPLTAALGPATTTSRSTETNRQHKLPDDVRRGSVDYHSTWHHKLRPDDLAEGIEVPPEWMIPDQPLSVHYLNYSL